MIEFTNIALDGTVDVITSDYADEYIYAGYAYTAADVNDRDYLKVIDAVGDTWYFKPASVPSYTVKEDKYGVYTVSEQVEDFEANDDLIFVTNSKGAIQYVINVDQSFAYNTATSKYDIAVDALVELYARIWDDAQPKAVTTYTVNGVGEYLLGDKVIVETLEGEYALVESDATGAADKYALIGAQDTIEIEVTGNMVVTDGLYDVVIDGETYYTTLASDANGDGKWNAAELAAIAEVAETGSYYEWVYGNGSEAMLPADNAGAYLKLDTYKYNEITFGYVSVTGVPGVEYAQIGDDIAIKNDYYDEYAIDVAVTGADIATARLNVGETETIVVKTDVIVEVTPVTGKNGTAATTTEELKDAIATGGTIVLAPGEYELAKVSAVTGDVTIIGANGTVVTGCPFDGEFYNQIVAKDGTLTVKGVIFDSEPTGSWTMAARLWGSVNATFEDCTFIGMSTAIYQSGADAVVTLENCTFETSGVAIQAEVYSGDFTLGQDLIIKNCDFTGLADVLHIYDHDKNPSSDAITAYLTANGNTFTGTCKQTAK